MSELKKLELELSIAEKHNFDKREIEHLKTLIEIEKAKIKPKKRNYLKGII